MSHYVLALLCAGLIAVAAWRVRALTLSGAVAAAVVGFCCFGLGGWLGAVSLLAFFGTSTALSKLGKKKKERLGYEKGGTRDALQVLANGGVAAICAVLGSPSALLGALATANADTWATEIGSLVGWEPRRITNFSRAAVGESGAISLPGTLAALAGAALIGAVGWAFGHSFLGVTVGGFLGALVDSLLGATVQVQYRDSQTGRITEQAAGNIYVRGWRWMNNDAVNALATLVGAVVATLFF